MRMQRRPAAEAVGRERKERSHADERSRVDDEPGTRLLETKDELFKLRFTLATGQLDKYHRINELRRDIARISHAAARARDRGSRSAEGRRSP